MYFEAIQLEQFAFPFRCIGPTRTPSIQGYSSPDGEHTDITRKWEWTKKGLDDFLKHRKKNRLQQYKNQKEKKANVE